MTKKQKIAFISLILVHILLLILVLTNKLNYLFNDATLRKGKAADFFAVYQAGNNIIKGESLYLDTEGVSTPYSFPFRYLPFIGYTLGVLFNAFSPFTAYYLWVIVNEILLAFNIYLTWKLTNQTRIFLPAIVPWLIFSPYLLEIYMGQWSFLLTSLLFYSIYGLIKKSRSIYFYIFAPLVKPNALVLVPLFLRFKKIKLLILNIITILFSSVLYFAFFRNDINIFMQNFKDTWYSHGGNFGFKSLYYLVIAKYLNIPLPRVWFFGFIVLLGILTLYLTFKHKNVILSYTLWTCYFFLVYKDIWEHHYVLLMPIFTLLIIKFKLTIREILSKKYILLLISFLLIALPSLFILQYFFHQNGFVEPDNLSPIFVIPYHSIKIIGITIIYIWTVIILQNSRKSL